uniref:Uncharacterized protein n=1 Tax=Aegilops tauschii subsp. strangulata TaxID=200361 RepID=A0A453LDK8_AEGTS
METPNSLASVSGPPSTARPAAVASAEHDGIRSSIPAGSGGGGASADSPEQFTTDDSDPGPPSGCWLEANLDMRLTMLLHSFFICPSSRVNRALSRRSRSFSSPISPDEEPAAAPPRPEPEPDGAASGSSSADPELDDRTCSSEESCGSGEPERVTGSAIGIAAVATVTAPAAAAAAAAASPADWTTFRRCMSQSRRFSPRRKQSLANSHRSGTIFLNPYTPQQAKSKDQQHGHSTPKIQKGQIPTRARGINQPNPSSERTYVGVELPHEAREVVVLEVLGEQVPGELRRPPHHERRPVLAPRDHVVHRRVLDELVRLGQERRRQGPLPRRVRRRRQPRHRRRGRRLRPSPVRRRSAMLGRHHAGASSAPPGRIWPGEPRSSFQMR